MEVTVDSNWRIRLPKPVLEHLGLGPGDRVRFAITSDDRLVILPKRVNATQRRTLKKVIETSVPALRKPRGGDSR
jgi:AbrB family looped-hinge helix DNA binding protein